MMEVDRLLFEYINGMDVGMLESILIAVRNKETWIPFYIVLIIYVIFQVGWRQALLFIVLSAGIVGVSDHWSSRVVKPYVERPRPCQDERLANDVKLRVACGTGYSFTSSHATNHMALAVFWYFALAPRNRSWRNALIFWAFMIGMAQVYVGVHYPSDVLVGFLFGGIIGTLFSCIYEALKKYNLSRG